MVKEKNRYQESRGVLNGIKLEAAKHRYLCLLPTVVVIILACQFKFPFAPYHGELSVYHIM